MTYKEWEKDLAKGIKTLPKGERARVLEYYREMFDEMTGGGRTESSVLEEFGLPEKCAVQALSEWVTRTESGEVVLANAREEKQLEIALDEARAQKKEAIALSRAVEKKRGRISAGEVVGLIFFTLLLVLPLGVSALALVISFGAISLSGGVIGLAGVVFAVGFPFTGNATGIANLAGVGIGIAASGVGLLLFVGFFYVTKGSGILFYRAIKAIYKRR